MSNSEKSPIISPKLVVVLGILAVSFASLLIRYAHEEVSSLVIAAYRLGISTLVLAPIALLRYRTALRKLSIRDFLFAVASGVFLALHFATWITSLEYTSVASSVVLVTTTPLWVALLSPITVKEPVTRVIAVGMVIALAGTVVIGLGDACTLDGGLICPAWSTFIEGKAFWGDLLALLGAFSVAGYVLIGRSLRSKLSLIPYIFLVYGAAAIVLLFFALGSGEKLVGFSLDTTIFLLLLAFVPQLFGHTTFNWALGYLPAAFVAVSLLGEPIGSTILAFIFLDEVPGVITMFGAILIFAGILIASRSEN